MDAEEHHRRLRDAGHPGGLRLSFPAVGGPVPAVQADGVSDVYKRQIYDFANYAFNKAHAVSYAVVAYQTAWFKCHYTREYMAALLTSCLLYTSSRSCSTCWIS